MNTDGNLAALARYEKEIDENEKQYEQDKSEFDDEIMELIEDGRKHIEDERTPFTDFEEEFEQLNRGNEHFGYSAVSWLNENISDPNCLFSCEDDNDEVREAQEIISAMFLDKDTENDFGMKLFAVLSPSLRKETLIVAKDNEDALKHLEGNREVFGLSEFGSVRVVEKESRIIVGSVHSGNDNEDRFTYSFLDYGSRKFPTATPSIDAAVKKKSLSERIDFPIDDPDNNIKNGEEGVSP